MSQPSHVCGARKQFINSIMVTNSFHFNSRLRFQLEFIRRASHSSRLTFIQFNMNKKNKKKILFPSLWGRFIFIASAIIVIQQLDCLGLSSSLFL